MSSNEYYEAIIKDINTNYSKDIIEAGSLYEFASAAVIKNYLIFSDLYNLDKTASQSEYEIEVLRINILLTNYVRAKKI